MTLRPRLADVYQLLAPFLGPQGELAEINVVIRSDAASSHESLWTRDHPALVTGSKVLLLRPLHFKQSSAQDEAYTLSEQPGGVYLASASHGSPPLLVGSVYRATVATLQPGIIVMAEIPLCSRWWRKHHAEVWHRPLALQRVVEMAEPASGLFPASECEQRLFLADTPHAMEKVLESRRAAVNITVFFQWHEEQEEERSRFTLKARQSVRSLVASWVQDITLFAPTYWLPNLRVCIRGEETIEKAVDWERCVGSLPRAALSGEVELTLHREA